MVGQRQAVTPAPPSSATSSSVRCVAWTAVKRSDSAPASASSPVGVRPCAARHSSFSFGCSETWACSGRPAAHSATTRADSGSTARTLWIAAPTRAVGRSSSRVHALGPGVGVGVAEALDAAVQVARVEQRDADARLGGRGEHGAAHRVRVVVGRAVRRVVEVVELADAGDAGQRHLAERRAREREAACRGRARRPARTSARARSRTSPSRRACARAARAGTRASARWRGPAASGPGEALARSAVARAAATPAPSTRRDPVALDLDQHARLRPLAPEPGELAPQDHEPTRSTSARARASNAARWWRSNCSQVENVDGSRTRSRNRMPSRWSTSCWNVPAVSPRRTSVVLDAVAVEVAHAHGDVALDASRAGPAPTGSPR